MPDASLCARLSVGVLLISLHPGEVGVVTPVLWIVKLRQRLRELLKMLGGIRDSPKLRFKCHSNHTLSLPFKKRGLYFVIQ